MSDLAGIRKLARQVARQSAPRKGAPKKFDLVRAVRQENLRTIPSSLWNELDSHLDHNPHLGLALAHVLHIIAKRSRNPIQRSTADLALIRAFNVCGEFKRALDLCEDAAHRFEILGDQCAVARVWLEAAWAETYLGNLNATEDYLSKVDAAFSVGGKNSRLEPIYKWVRARILLQQGSLTEALTRLEDIYQELRQHKQLDAARVLREIGHLRARLDPSDALPPLRQARAAFQQAACPTEAAQCDHILAQALIDLNRFEQAENHLIHAQTIFRQQTFYFFDALCDLELGFLACERDLFQDSLVNTTRAHAIFVQLDAKQEASSCEVNLGWALMRLNRYEEALGYLEHAAQIALDTGRQAKAAVCFSNMGLVYEKQGRYAQALDFHQRARDILAQAKMVERLVESDLALGQLYAQLGDFQQALVALTRARRVCLREHMSASLAECELYRAYIFFQRRRFALARNTLETARRLFAKNQQTTSTAFCERLLARLESKHPRKARTHLAYSRKIFSASKLTVDAALCDMTFADLALGWGEWRTARRALLQAKRVFGTSFPDQTWRIAFGLGKVAHAQNDLQGARRFYLQAADMLARLRGELRLEDLSNVAFESRHYALDDALAFMEQHGSPHDVLTLLETAKAQTFVHTLAIREWRIANRVSEQGKALTVQEQELRRELDTARAKLMPTPVIEPGKPTRGGRLSFDERTSARARLGRLEHTYERIAAQRRLIQPGLTGAPTLRPFNLAALRVAANARWGSGWSALEYYFANGRLYILEITPDDVHVSSDHWSHWDQSMLEQCATTDPDLREVVYRKTLHGIPVNTVADTALEHLAGRLIPSALLESKKRTLLVAPHGLLHQLPFHALRVQDTPLLERFTFLYTPNLQAFTQLAEPGEQVKRARWLFCGVSDFGPRARFLKHTQSELAALEKLAPAYATFLREKTATRAQFLEWNRTNDLARYEVLHFATHAIVEPRAPHTSRIMLADQDLTVLDVIELNLNARLVTLSGCSSAIGKGGGGDEWLGLTRAFFYAGARTLVASLWEVEDESTALLMELFYQNLREGQAIADALRHAQLTLRSRGYSAYHWAPFMILGAGGNIGLTSLSRHDMRKGGETQ